MEHGREFRGIQQDARQLLNQYISRDTRMHAAKVLELFKDPAFNAKRLRKFIEFNESPSVAKAQEAFHTKFPGRGIVDVYDSLRKKFGGVKAPKR